MVILMDCIMDLVHPSTYLSIPLSHMGFYLEKITYVEKQKMVRAFSMAVVTSLPIFI